MRLSLAVRTFAMLMLFTIVLIAAQTLATRAGFERSFRDYVAQQDRRHLEALAPLLASQYERDGDWRRLAEDRRAWHDLVRLSSGDIRAPVRPPPPKRQRNEPSSASEDARPPKRRPPPGGADPLSVSPRLSLLDTTGLAIVGSGARHSDDYVQPIELNGAVIGTLVMRPLDAPERPEDIAFARSQSRSVLVAAVAAVALAIALAGLFARQLSVPIRTLASAMRALRGGDYERTVTLASATELRDLADDYNTLAATLKKNRESRRRWVSDIAHELRTPLAVLAAEIEALHDGIRPLDKPAMLSLADEVARLSSLVGDLNQLAKADSGELEYHFAPLLIGDLLQDAVDGAEARLAAAGIAVTLTVDQGLTVQADRNRLRQVIDNLIENTCRYTDAPGRLTIKAHRADARARIVFTDSAPGVPDGAHDRLFDRLYRADASRSRSNGGAGLGLAICKAIVVAHNGEIFASAAPGGGLVVEILLPIEVSR